MKSRIIDNLYFAGEVMDVDAFTGGYNVQIALSTGYIAGKHLIIANNNLLLELGKKLYNLKIEGIKFIKKKGEKQ